jgi:hypothetical protein
MFAILALAAGCAAQPASPAAPRAADQAAATRASIEANVAPEGNASFYVGDLSWSTSTSSTHEMPAPIYSLGATEFTDLGN